jgi:predicted membrane-bound spermidine synthase
VRHDRPGLVVPALAFFASGAAALVYQVVWQRILALHTGVGTASVALIVAAFMAGLGLGSHLGGQLSARLSARRALVAFALVELAIGLFGAVSVPLYYDGLYVRAGALYSRAALGALLQVAALLPPTTLMGLSLPLLVRATVLDARSAGRTIGLLYALNMLGAAAGAALTPWVLVRHLGLDGATLVAAAANALAAALVVPLASRLAEPAGADGPAADPACAGFEPAGGRPLALWVALYAGSGFCALSLEILWFRLLEVATRSTAFAFGTLLAVYLGGSGLGCAAGAWGAPRLARPLRTFLLCQCALLGCAGLAVLLLVTLPTGVPGLAWLWQYWRAGEVFHLGRDANAGALLRLYVALPLALFGVPTFLMGLSFPVLQRAVQDDPATSGRKVGVLQAANIAGCAGGSLLVGLAGLDSLGTAGSLKLLVAAGAAFAALGIVAYGRRSAFAVLAPALLALAAALPGNGALWGRLHATESRQALLAEDATSVSAVVPWPDGWRVIVNGKLHSRLPFGGVHTRLGATPALVHPRPEQVAIVGLGSGDTAWAAGCRPETRRITVFELAGRQLELLASVSARTALPDLARFLADPRVVVVVADGRHSLARGAERYDVIEADALWPDAAYSGNLYSVEFFRACAARLRPGGLMCTWAPTRRVAASFRRAFPCVLMPRDRSFLLGSNEPVALDAAAWLARASSPEVARYLGPSTADELARSLARLLPLPAAEPDEPEPNRDLYPRDEFLAP